VPDAGRRGVPAACQSGPVNTEDPTWVVLARDVSGAVTVADQPLVVIALILDAGTGLVRGVSVGDTVRRACTDAARTALSAPAGPLPPRRPAEVVYDEAQADGVLAALADVLPGLPPPALVAGSPPAEAEDIFDSLIGHLTGVEQPTDPPGPQDWVRLYARASAYCRAQPWHLWSDADRLDLTTDVDGECLRSVVIVYGGQGIQSGLAALPALHVPDGRGSSNRPAPTASPALPAGSLVLFLDPTHEVPHARLAKAVRHGWPDDADLAPVVARVGSRGLADLDRAGVRHLTLALTAVVAHRGPRSSDTTTGTVLLDGDVPGRYAISDRPPADVVRPPAPHPPSATCLPSLPAPLPLPALRTARLRVTLREVTPPVVRVVDVPAAATLPELHNILQVAIGWTDSHLHEFETADGLRYGSPDLDFGYEVRDETTATLRDLPARFTYRYDFGDGWEHDVEVTGRGAATPGCADGQGACPPEDCGGTHGYAELRQALTDPTHPDHDHLSEWASGWTETDRLEADRLVRATVGQVPASVRLLLDFVGDKVRLTPGGRLPRTLVRAVQEQRPGWALRDKPAFAEEDLPPLADLHELLRRVGLLRLARGILTPTKAAGDDLQIVRRLRRVFEPDGFDDILAGVAAGHLAARGALPRSELAALSHPWLDRWAVGGRPVTPDDVDTRLTVLSDQLEALDLVQVDRRTWHPGPAAETLLPMATALAHIFRRTVGCATRT
jgi:hypothetical protein